MRLKTKLFFLNLYCNIFHKSFLEVISIYMNREGRKITLKCGKCLRTWIE